MQTDVTDSDDPASHQARPFHEKPGYIVFATLENDHPGLSRFLMAKRFDR